MIWGIIKKNCIVALPLERTYKLAHKGDESMQTGVWLGVIFSAILAFVIGFLYDQTLHWYLFILIICTGFFINTIIMILKTED